jgi:hypothetical protein
MVAPFLLQVLGLIGLPIGGFMTASWGGAVIGASVSVIYVGIAAEGGDT